MVIQVLDMTGHTTLDSSELSDKQVAKEFNRLIKNGYTAFAVENGVATKQVNSLNDVKDEVKMVMAPAVVAG